MAGAWIRDAEGKMVCHSLFGFPDTLHRLKRTRLNTEEAGVDKGTDTILADAALSLIEAIEKKCETYAESNSRAMTELQLVTRERDFLKLQHAKQRELIAKLEEHNKYLSNTNHRLNIMLHTPRPLYQTNPTK
jgi:hypothetical protein